MHSSQAVAQSVFRVGRFVNGRCTSKRYRFRGSTASLLLERYECVVRVNLLWYVCKSIEAAGTWKHTSQIDYFRSPLKRDLMFNLDSGSALVELRKLPASLKCPTVKRNKNIIYKIVERSWL